MAFGVVACGGSNNDDLLSHPQGGTAGSGATGAFTGGTSVSRGGDSASGGIGTGGAPSAGAGGDAGGTDAEGGAATNGGSNPTAGSGGKQSGGATATGGRSNATGGSLSGGAGGTASGGAGGNVSGGTSGAASGGKSGATGGSGSGGQAGGGGAAGAGTCGGKCDVNAECKISGNTASCVCNDGYVGNGRTCALPISCRELHEAAPSLASGAYTLKPSGGNNEFDAYCEMTAQGGGWTLVLNEGPSFMPSTRGSDVQCFRQDCTSLAYSRVPLVSDVMLDVRDGPIVANNYLARVVVTGVEADTRNRTVRELFNDGPYYLEKEDNSNLVVQLSGNGTCADSLPSDFAALVCSSCAADEDDCSAPVITFGDTDPGCVDDPDYAFAMGGSESYSEPWGNCAGWPQTPDVGDFNYYPHNVRIWVR